MFKWFSIIFSFGAIEFLNSIRRVRKTALSYVYTIPDIFCAGTWKTFLNGVSVHTYKER